MGDQSRAELQVKPMLGGLGAELEGVNIASELDADQVTAIQAALWQNHLVVFRDQPLNPQ